MVRAVQARRSPKVTSAKHNNAFKSAFRPLLRSPIAYKQPVLPSRSTLYSIREESPELEKSRDISRDADALLGQAEGDSDSGSDESDFEGWDDETTLVLKLQSDAPQVSEREQLVALAHSLEGPMQAHGASLKQYLAHTIAPAAKRVKDVHAVIEQRVDVAFGVGVLEFDDVCKRVETLALQDEDELKDMFVETQRNVTKLFTQLKAAYERRDRLWTHLQESVDHKASQALESLRALPAEIDEAALSIDKRAKELSKSGAVDGKAREKMLRELLATM
ncbi:hypothetical protein BD410DRAFT_766761 [Rickenella mellea]|uniref:Uncharacterized protein n=1 Tax=Rickenella mellea TaxID=50990 RepID=A0A4Y7QDU4_9AGAM|nr:hypothetical protein BD410DRAFT_766761 [Rickenella mellea]